MGVGIAASLLIGCSNTVRFHRPGHEYRLDGGEQPLVLLEPGEEVLLVSGGSATHAFAVNPQAVAEDPEVVSFRRERIEGQGRALFAKGGEPGFTRVYYGTNFPEPLLESRENRAEELRGILREKQAHYRENLGSYGSEHASGFNREMDRHGWQLVETDLDALDEEALERLALRVFSLSWFQLVVHDRG